VEASLHGDCGLERITCPREHEEKRIPLRVDLSAAVVGGSRPQETVMVSKHFCILVSERLQKACRPFDICKKEGDGSRRQDTHCLV
jgi:hypothetical protein